jgi:hypothetical protein
LFCAYSSGAEGREYLTNRFGVVMVPDKPVWSGDGVQVGLLPVVHEGVGLPDLAQHLYGQGEGILAGILSTDYGYFSQN